MRGKVNLKLHVCNSRVRRKDLVPHARLRPRASNVSPWASGLCRLQPIGKAPLIIGLLSILLQGSGLLHGLLCFCLRQTVNRVIQSGVNTSRKRDSTGRAKIPQMEGDPVSRNVQYHKARQERPKSWSAQMPRKRHVGHHIDGTICVTWAWPF